MILQAMATGCPVISSTIGAERAGRSACRHFLLADKVDDWSPARYRAQVRSPGAG